MNKKRKASTGCMLEIPTAWYWAQKEATGANTAKK